MFARSVREDPRQVLEREAGFPPGRCWDDDSVEVLDLPESFEGMDRRAAALDPSVDGNSRLRGSVLHGLQERYRHCTLLTHLCIERKLWRDQDQVGGDERGVFGAGDPQRGVEDGRVEVPARERDEQPRRRGPASGCRRRSELRVTSRRGRDRRRCGCRLRAGLDQAGQERAAQDLEPRRSSGVPR